MRAVPLRAFPFPTNSVASKQHGLLNIGLLGEAKRKKKVSEKNVMKTSRKEKENHRPPATGLPTSSSHYRVHSPATAGPAAAAAAAA